MRRLLGLLLLVSLGSGCGFIAKPRLSEAYLENCWSKNDGVNLVIWPVNLTVAAGCAGLDQGARTFEAIPPAAEDAWDFAWIQGNGNNIMLGRTVAVPKLVATPIVFVSSYVVRWLLPFSSDKYMFSD